MTEFAAGLYVVATPIGNLGDLSKRALEVLEAAVMVAAEDTRTSGKLVRLAGGAGQMVSLTEHNVTQRAPQILEAARAGPVALVSDAGTPVVADPGARLVDAAHTAGVPVYAIPGPSALAAAVSVSGFEGSDVHFLGFLPKANAERKARLTAAGANAAVLVFFESPNRLAATLRELGELLPSCEVAVCRELTKVYEEVVRGSAAELAARFGAARGECTVVVRVPARAAVEADDAQLREYMAEMQRAGARRAPAAAEAVRRFGVPRDRAYTLWEER